MDVIVAANDELALVVFADKVSILDATEELLVVYVALTLLIELANDWLLLTITADMLSILIAKEELFVVTVPYKELIEAAADELFDVTV